MPGEEDFPLSSEEGAGIYMNALSGQVYELMQKGDSKDVAIRKVVDSLVEVDWFGEPPANEELTEEQEQFYNHLRTRRKYLTEEKGLSLEEATKILVGAIISLGLEEYIESLQKDNG